ncbi:hypothetical protein ACFVZC_33505 [Streptomyces marokkonensis]|uniref:Uncharacterized protein n=1 Tax=Streptomyces marokkonensis TaxID=324855 RepID=A0ABW6QG96_9ACTN
MPDSLSAKIFRPPAAVRASSCRSSFCPAWAPGATVAIALAGLVHIAVRR